MVKEQIISPISIDLGAKNTGVYFAHYKAGSSIEDIEKEGKVYQLEKDSYTLLMANRTARRHQRRGFDRRQMVKRLFKLIWEKHFGLEWDKDVQQTTSFLFNRRGFSFLTEEYDAEILSRFPEEAHQALPKELQIAANNGEYDFAVKIQEWAREGENKVKEVFDAINKKPKHVAERLVFIGRTEKLREHCQTRKSNNEINENNKARVKLSQLSRWIWDEWQQAGVEGLDEDFVAKDQSSDSEIRWKTPVSYDLVTYLNQQSPEVAHLILNSLPDTSEEKKELGASCWNFKAENFKLEDKDFTRPEPHGENATKKEKDNYQKAVSAWNQLHLQHLAFALQKTLNELQSGGRHRSKYFEEIKEVLKEVLENQNHTHGYLKEFCGKLQSGSLKPKDSGNSLTDKTLANLICHLSNLELKPLRKYFNDKTHKDGDYWDESRLKGIFKKWILHEWRINPEKDKRKVQDGEENYKKLRYDWHNHEGSVVCFWMTIPPVATIPPYQDNNNRRPPRCQSLILNPTYLDNNYSEWQIWLEKLKELPAVQAHLRDFEEQLKGMQSGKKKSYFSDETTPTTKKDKNGNQVHKTQEEIRAGDSQRRNSKALNARILQFIFDRVKADDPLKLNEIYSHAKKIKQDQHKSDTDSAQAVENAKKKLEQSINCNSNPLPKTLKTLKDYQNDALFKHGTFLHLICKYYKIRQRARDGRLFIHPEYRYVRGHGYENTGCFDDANCLLTYCNHKPRQKRYQILGDIASLLQVKPVNLREFVEDQDGKTADEKLFEWLNSIDALKTNCDRAAKEQKDRRGRLKLDIRKIYRQRQSESTFEGKIKKILKDSGVDEAYKLYRFCERAKDLCLAVTEPLYDISRQQEWQQDLENNPATAVYLLAQINDIAFKERNGNANTCAVCSTDNAQRMQMIPSENIEESHTKAQRLPAIKTRLIDGAVMRMARIAAVAIIKDKWPNIEKELNANKKVHVPIIIEANRFEFEPSKEELVKSQRVTPRKGKALTRADGQILFQDKDTRIKKAGQCICPYTGKALTNTGEIDHIIPRQSEWGTLNDEANLIWASRIGNHHKINSHLSLRDLHNEYKNAQFGDKDDDRIQQWIIDQIGNGEGENFTFGPYRSFINLSPEHQKAFRHALFLPASHSLRRKVIEAIDNRNRTLVNGTQRYFAEVLANNLYKAAKKKCKQNLLSFDYFESSTDAGSSNVNVPSVRKYFEGKKDDNGNYRHPELQRHIKGNTSQSSYSHLIDATTSFMIALSKHYKSGSLEIETPYISPYDYSDDSGELKDLYAAVKIDYSDFIKHFGLEPLERQIPGPNKPSVAHRPLFNENAVALHFLKLIEIQEPNEKPKYLRGFLALSELKKCLRAGNDGRFESYKKYASELSDTDRDKYLPIYTGKFAVGSGTGTSILTGFGEKRVTVNIYSLDKKKVFGFLIDHFNTASDVSLWQTEKVVELKSLYSLWYFTQRQKIIVKDSGKETLYRLSDNNKKCARLINPQIENAWNDLAQSIDDSQNLREQLKDYFLNKENSGQRVPKHTHEHKRVAKEFSLPISCQKGLLIRKKNWKGEEVYYCRPVSNDFSQTLLHKGQDGVIPDSDKDERLVNCYRQKNIFYSSDNFAKLKKELRPVDATSAIDPNKYYEAQIPQEFIGYLCKVENQRTDSERPRFRFYLKGDKKMDFPTFKKFILKYPFRNLQDLRASLRKEWVINKISDVDSLKNGIEEVERMDKKPKKLLPALKEMKTLYEESQQNQILAYSAKGKFTLKLPDAIKISH